MSVRLFEDRRSIVTLPSERVNAPAKVVGLTVLHGRKNKQHIARVPALALSKPRLSETVPTYNISPFDGGSASSFSHQLLFPKHATD